MTIQKQETPMPLLASDYDRSKYLRAEDLKRETKFRIKAVTEEVFEKDGKQEKKLLLGFTNDDRGLVLNKINNRTIRSAFGDPVAGWIGKIIIIYPMVADFRGKMTPALRVRIPPPKPSASQPAAPQQPVFSGNGPAAAALAVAPAAPPAAAAIAAADPELEPDPVKPIHDELDDDIPW
jgi:hypothetical protein